MSHPQFIIMTNLFCSWNMMGWNYKKHCYRHKRTSRRERLWKTSDYTHCFKSLVALHRFDWVCQIISLNHQIVRTKDLLWCSLKSNNFLYIWLKAFSFNQNSSTLEGVLLKLLWFGLPQFSLLHWYRPWLLAFSDLKFIDQQQIMVRS